MVILTHSITRLTKHISDQINQDILKARNEIKRNSAVPKVQITDVENVQTNVDFVAYGQRWWILSTLMILIIANIAQMVAFTSVVGITTEHYGQSKQRMNYRKNCKNMNAIMLTA
mgnify:CR=1 FL=1